MMSSTDPWILSRTDERARDLEPEVRAGLMFFAKSPAAHARFLNTLSLMEHIGSRKIMTSQPGPGHDTLKHLAEEARHAFFFKREAEKLSKTSLDYSHKHTFAGAAARMYMGRLDAGIARETGPGALAYLYMSLIVELRAIWTYRLYQSVLKEAGAALNLNSVLAEEELHLAEMWEQIGEMDTARDERLMRFADFEDARFRALWAALAPHAEMAGTA